MGKPTYPQIKKNTITESLRNVCLVNYLTHDESVNKKYQTSQGIYKTQTHDLAPNSAGQAAEERPRSSDCTLSHEKRLSEGMDDVCLN